jgi:hypothetical protein
MPIQTGTLYTLEETAINVVSVGAVRTKAANAITASIEIFFAQTTATTPAAGTRIVVEADTESTGNSWVPVATLITGPLLAELEALTGTIAAAATVLTCASTTNFGPRTELIFIRNTTLANSEWAEVTTISSNASVTVKDGIVNAQTGSTIYDQASRFLIQFDCSGFSRYRVIVDNNNQATGPTVAVQSFYAEYIQ